MCFLLFSIFLFFLAIRIYMEGFTILKISSIMSNWHNKIRTHRYSSNDKVRNNYRHLPYHQHQRHQHYQHYHQHYQHYHQHHQHYHQHHQHYHQHQRYQRHCFIIWCFVSIVNSIQKNRKSVARIHIFRRVCTNIGCWSYFFTIFEAQYKVNQASCW